MKINFIYVIAFFISTLQFTYAQQKEVEQAVKSGKTGSGYYEVNKEYDVAKFNKWYNSHKDEYFIIDYKAFEINKFQTRVNVVKWFAFVPINELTAYKWNKLQEEQRLQQAKNMTEFGNLVEAVGFIAIGVAVYIGVSALSNYTDNSVSGSSSPSSNKKPANSSNETTVCYTSVPDYNFYNCAVKVSVAYTIHCNKANKDHTIYYWPGGDGGDKIKNCVWDRAKGWRENDHSLNVDVNASMETAAKKVCGCE